MKTPRSRIVTAGVVAAAALAVTGITYASADSAPVAQVAPAPAPAPAAAPAAAPADGMAAGGGVAAAPAGGVAVPFGNNGGIGFGGNGFGGNGFGGNGFGFGGNGFGGNGFGGNGFGFGFGGNGFGGNGFGFGFGGNGFGGNGFEDRDFEGRIQVNERSYSSRAGDCITVVSGLGARTLNIRNESRRTVEVFRGAVCDNGAPIAVVGPFSQSDGVNARHTDGIHVEDGVVGSFRVIRRHYGW
ncbi:hypothetical protein [Streptomyces sp. NPDC002758]